MKKNLRRFLRIFLLLAGLFVLYLAATIGFAMYRDYDPPLSESVETPSTTNSRMIVSYDTITLMSWNLGYMGLGEESDFFYDGGKAVYMPEAIVQKNRTGILGRLAEYREQVDFFLLQEVDRNSKRSHYQDEYAAIGEQLPGFQPAFATNYQVDFIPIPLTEPMGRVWSGLATFSRTPPTEATRYSFEGNYDWPTYLFFLDRCFLLTRFPLSSERELVVINTHNSAYDDGSLKQKQMAQLKSVLLAEYAKGNAVIVGGDWNQFPPHYEGVEGFPLQESEKEPRFFVPESYPAPDWQWATDMSVPTNRSLVSAFDADTSRRYVIDYFLLSPNVSLLNVEGVDLGFRFSDHQPVRVKVAL